MSLDIMTFRIMTLSITTLDKDNEHIMTLRIMSLNITTFSITIN